VSSLRDRGAGICHGAGSYFKSRELKAKNMTSLFSLLSVLEVVAPCREYHGSREERLAKRRAVGC